MNYSVNYKNLYDKTKKYISYVESVMPDLDKNTSFDTFDEYISGNEAKFTINKRTRFTYPKRNVEMIYTPYVWSQTYFYNRVKKNIISKLESKNDYQPVVPWYMLEEEWRDINLMKRVSSNYSIDADYKAIKYNINKSNRFRKRLKITILPILTLC